MTEVTRAAVVELERLGVTIRDHHERTQAAFGAAVQEAILCGKALTAAKAKVKHGEWLPWLKANVEFTSQTASGYMRLAEHAAQIEGAPSISVALKQLAAPRSEGAEPLTGLAAHEARAEAGLIEFAEATRQARDTGEYSNAGEQGAWREYCEQWGHSVTSMDQLIQRYAPVPVLTESADDVGYETGKAMWLMLSDDQRRQVVERAADEASRRGDHLDAARLYIKLAESYGTPVPWEEG